MEDINVTEFGGTEFGRLRRQLLGIISPDRPELLLVLPQLGYIQRKMDGAIPERKRSHNITLESTLKYND